MRGGQGTPFLAPEGPSARGEGRDEQRKKGINDSAVLKKSSDKMLEEFQHIVCPWNQCATSGLYLSRRSVDALRIEVRRRARELVRF